MNINNLNNIKNKNKILICGCKGQLGKALSEKKNKKYKIYLTNKTNLDITKYKILKKKLH